MKLIGFRQLLNENSLDHISHSGWWQLGEHYIIEVFPISQYHKNSDMPLGPKVYGRYLTISVAQPAQSELSGLVVWSYPLQQPGSTFQQQSALVLATDLYYLAAVQIVNWTRQSSMGCYPDSRGIQQVQGRVRTGLRFHCTVPITLAPI